MSTNLRNQSLDFHFYTHLDFGETVATATMMPAVPLKVLVVTWGASDTLVEEVTL